MQLRIVVSWILTLGICAPAHAQSAGDRAAAEDLFRQGRALMKKGSYAEACPKLEASNRLDPAFGTQVNLGDCYEKIGKVVSAWASYSEAIDLARKEGQSDRVSMAQKRLATVESRLSRLKITLAQGADVPGLTVTRDGQPIDRALVGSATPVDPGEYTIAASASGYKPWQGTAKLTEGQTTTVEVGTLEKIPVAEKPPVPPPENPQEQPAKPVVIPDTTVTAAAPPDPGKGRRMLGLGVGVAGVIALGVGGYFGLNAFSKWNDAKDMCHGPGGSCTPAGVDLGNQASSSATMANILVGGGIALVATGIILYVTAPHAEAAAERAPQSAWRVAPGAGASPFGLTVESRF